MRLLDWLVVAAYLLWIVVDGLRRTKAANEVEGYLLANRSLPWWAVGLSVMATQLSAITLVGTTGQAYADGMRFIQFYFGLPIAMVVLSVTLVPFFYRSGVYTAYEYLERRFDAKTRTLASLLFLCGRSMSTGAIISAPAVILSVIFHWNLTLTILAIGGPTILYTMLGGVQAVTWTDVKQMAIVVGGLVCAVVALILGLPHEVGVDESLHIAGAAGRATNTIDFHFDPRQTYTFWSGLVGGLFLHLSVLRLRPESGAALPDREVTETGATLAADERVRQDPAAGAGAARRRVHVPVLCLSSAADALQRGVCAADRQERAGGRIPSARGGVLEGVRRCAARRRWPWRRRRRQRASGLAPGFATRRPRFRRFAPALRRLSRTSPPLQATRIPLATRQSRTSTMCFRRS